MLQRFREFLNHPLTVFRQVRDNEQNLPQNMEQPNEDSSVNVMLPQDVDQQPPPPTDQRAESPERRQAIYFEDDVLLYALLLEWDPRTNPPLVLQYTLDGLNKDYLYGVQQTPLKIFYRIFLRRQLSKNWAKRPRFLTPERRDRINRRCRERREAAARV